MTLPGLVRYKGPQKYITLVLLIVMAGFLLGIAGATLRSPNTGWDFPVFYIAAHVPLDKVYSPSAYSAFWREHLAPIGVVHWAPFVRPAVFVLPLRAILSGPYYESLKLWLASGFLLYGLSILILAWRFRITVFFVLASILYVPAVLGIASGADIALFLLAIILGLISIQNGNPLRAALFLILCLCKFNLILLFPLMLFVKKEFRILAALLAGVVMIVTISLYLAPLESYISIVRTAPKIAGGFYPVGLRGFSYAIGQPWCYLPLAVLGTCISPALFWKLPLPDCFAVAITGSLMISPYVTWYDSVLLVFPIALICSQATQLIRYAFLLILVAVPLWLYGGGLNGPVGFMHIGVEVLIIAFFIRRALINSPRLDGMMFRLSHAES